MSDRSPITNDELRLLYQVTVSDLAYFKTQQWSVTNYAFLLLAGVVGTWQLVKGDASLLERGALSVLAALVAAATLTVLGKLEASIQVRQSRLVAARERFSVAFYEAWSAETKSQEYVHSIVFLRAAVVLGVCVVGWLVWRH